MSYPELATRDLLAKFASAEPAPGGGSASALAGSLAGSLAQMVCRLTIGKKNYEGVEAEVSAMLPRVEAISERLLASVEGDAAAFDRVMAAMGMPKATDEEKAARSAAMQEAFKGATTSPIGVAQACLEAGKLALSLVAIGNQNASTDAGVAVLLAVAGGEGALFNAEINLGSIKDAAWVEARRAELGPLWADLAGLRAGLWPAMRTAGVDTPR